MVLLLTSAGCQSVGQDLLERRTREAFEQDLLDLSPELVSWHHSIPYFSPRSEDSCGVSCLDSVLALKDCRLPEEVVVELEEAAEQEQGLTNGQLREALQEAGLLAIHLQGEWRWPTETSPAEYQRYENPLHHVDLGNPPILRIAVPDNRFHFVLLVGYDAPTRNLIVMNPGRGMQVWKDSALDSWRLADRWFVAYKTPE